MENKAQFNFDFFLSSVGVSYITQFKTVEKILSYIDTNKYKVVKMSKYLIGNNITEIMDPYETHTICFLDLGFLLEKNPMEDDDSYSMRLSRHMNKNRWLQQVIFSARHRNLNLIIFHYSPKVYVDVPPCIRHNINFLFFSAIDQLNLWKQNNQKLQQFLKSSGLSKDIFVMDFIEDKISILI